MRNPNVIPWTMYDWNRISGWDCKSCDHWCAFKGVFTSQGRANDYWSSGHRSWLPGDGPWKCMSHSTPCLDWKYPWGPIGERKGGSHTIITPSTWVECKLGPVVKRSLWCNTPMHVLAPRALFSIKSTSNVELFLAIELPEKIPHIGNEDCSYPWWLGKLEEFDLNSGEDWTQYIERMEFYFLANSITDTDKEQAILLSTIGAQAYKVLRNLISPSAPSEKSFKQLVQTMTKHFCPPPSEIVQRFKFNTSQYCKFGETLESMLSTIVCGINDAQRLLAEKNLTYANAREIALALESAVQGTKDIQSSLPQYPVHTVSQQSAATGSSIKCFRCGRTNHKNRNAGSRIQFARIVIRQTTWQKSVTASCQWM